MATIATGPAPPSRGALLGQQAGGALGIFLAQQLRQRQAQQAQEQAQAAAVQQLTALANVLAAGGNPLSAATGATPVGAPNPLAAGTVPVQVGPPSAPMAAQAPTAPGVDPARFQALLANRDALANLLANVEPDKYVETIQSMLQAPQGPAPITVGANERLVDPRTGQPIVDVVPQPAEPATEIARLRADLQRGLITPEEFRQQRQRILSGAPAAPRQAARDIDVLLPDGTRMPAVGLDTGAGVLVADAQGRFRTLPEVFPNAVGIAPTTRRTQEIPPPMQPFTQEDFVAPRSFGGIDPTAEGVGPLDRAMAALSRVPGVGQTAQALFGDDFGAKERAGNRIFMQLENRVVSAFRPGADNQLSNKEMDMARRLVPSYGAFATEDATVQDLQTLRGMASSLMESSLRVANQPDRFDSTIVRAAQQRLIELGDVTSMIDGLLMAREGGALAPSGAPQALTPQRVQAMSQAQLAQTVQRMSEEDLRRLDDETLRLLNERLQSRQ